MTYHPPAPSIDLDHYTCCQDGRLSLCGYDVSLCCWDDSDDLCVVCEELVTYVNCPFTGRRCPSGGDAG